MYRLAPALGLLAALSSSAQDTLRVVDSTRLLEPVVVTAYQSNRAIEEVPASVGVVDATLMNRFANTSLVSAVNTVPGVRMEERSPGSYRFSIRGSLLRSPFGVRNVKFYWRGLPFTDGGGNTYLNVLDFTSVSNMEIIKGPGSSLYGAGTGGVVLMQPAQRFQQFLRASMMGGSYGLRQFAFGIGGGFGREGTEKNFVKMTGGTQRSQGYRDQTEMSRFNGNIEYAHFEENSSFSAVIFGSQLHYETPGGLTLAQYQEDPSKARPGVPATPTRPAVPGAEEQKAAIKNSPVYAAVSYEHDVGEHWTYTLGLYGTLVDFRNPAVLNYETRSEGNVGSRASADYFFGKSNKQKITFGAEGQYFNSKVEVSANSQGDKGALTTKDNLTSNSVFSFLQADFQLPLDFYLTVGGSANFLKYEMERTYPVEDVQTRNFKPGFFPRVALLKKFYQRVSAYATVSDGFSAPAFAEVLPNTGIYNNLNPERGTNIEGGLKAEFFGRRLTGQAAYYNFRLNDAIVNVSGGDDYQNAGETSQKGFEGTISWAPNVGSTILRIWSAYSYNYYYFVDYVRAGTDYSGNELTGVPRNVLVGGVDVTTRQGWYLNSTVNRTDRIPLNDLNSEYAHEYLLIGARIGRQAVMKNPRFVGIRYNVFAGVDNALNQTYSLGNDLNAAGGRYYNAAPKRNYYIGLSSPIGR